MPRWTVTIPGLHTKTPGNSREHWRAEARRTKQQRDLTRLTCGQQLGPAVRDAIRSAPALRVRLVRVGPRRLDTPNVFGACKAALDGFCDWTGIDDRSAFYVWEMPAQETGPYAVRIELSTEG